MPTHPTRTAIIRLKVDGYPRAFLYELALSRDNQGRDIRRDERSIRLTSLQMQNEPRVFRTGRRDEESEPTAGDEEKVEALYLQPGRPAAFGVPGKGNAILVGFEVDAPLDAFSFRDRSDVIEIGFSKAGFPTTRLFSDRARHAWLHTPTRNGFAVSTQVDDYVGEHAVPLDIAGLKNARVRVRARLEVDQNDPPPHELEVVLDGEAPVVTSLHAPAVVQQGHPVSISMDVKDLSGPAQAVIGIVARRGDPLKLEQAFVQERFSSTATTDRWPIVASLDSAQLVPNEYFVKTRVTDRVGRQTEALTSVTIVAPLPIKKEKAQPLRGTIRGVVRFGPSFKPDRITVRINGGAFEPTTTANGGRFRFENVPAGNYTLEARGPVKGYIKQGKTDIELKQKADYAREISIDLTESGS